MLGPKIHKINYEYCINTKTTTKCAKHNIKIGFDNISDNTYK